MRHANRFRRGTNLFLAAESFSDGQTKQVLAQAIGLFGAFEWTTCTTAIEKTRDDRPSWTGQIYDTGGVSSNCTLFIDTAFYCINVRLERLSRWPQMFQSLAAYQWKMHWSFASLATTGAGLYWFNAWCTLLRWF